MRKIILSALGIVFILLASYLGNNISESKKQPRPIPVKVIKTVFIDTVKNGTVKIIVPANGSLTAKRRIEVFSEVQGVFRIGSKLFRPGQKYSTGDVFIRIDNTEYYANVQSAKSNFYNTLTSVMPDLKLDFPDVFEKWKTYINSFDLNETTPNLPVLTSEKEKYFITGRGIISGYYNVKNLEQRLSKYVISVPFNGILTEALVTEGSLIRSGQKLGEYIDDSVYELEVAVSRNYASLLKVGENVSLNNLEKTETYNGTVSRINGNVDLSSQTISAFIEVKHDVLKEGMYLEAQLGAKEETNVIEIDRNLLSDKNEVFIVKDSLLFTYPVEPVFFGDNKVVIKGIPNGTFLLAKSVPGAYPGMLVKPFIKNTKQD
ncbi:efflux RND transporter periplasmic adaptor subunit [Flavobacteriaceae bacterium]|jgi:membrane fusion protein, multidrug efflux system|nr:efflux RND transporter periplasmic adaptor subunit [Flavobacteriaceae bacterium]